MGKALAKTCLICNNTISGNNWARHKQTHPKVAEIKFRIVNKPVSLKKGRPQSPNKYPLDNGSTVRSVKLRGMALYTFKENRMLP